MATDTPSEEALAVAFLKERCWITKHIIIDSLWNCLRAQEMISKREEDKMKKFMVEEEQVAALIDLLEKKQKLREFYQLLRNEHGNVVKKIKPLIDRMEGALEDQTEEGISQISDAEGQTQMDLRAMLSAESSPAVDIDKQGHHMPTVASTSLTDMELNESEELSGASDTENLWCFEISNETDYLESGSRLPYPIEVFVPTGALSMGVHTKLKVNVKQMDNHNDTSPLTGNRQLGPFIQFEADQAHVQFVRPLLVFIKFPEHLLIESDDYEYCVQCNSGKDILEGMWNDITGYREGEVSGEVIPSHQTAVLLLPHFTWFIFTQRCKMVNVELYANHLQQQDTHFVMVTCLVYLKPLRGTQEHKDEMKYIKGEFQNSEAMSLTQIDQKEEVVLVSSHHDEPWHLKDDNLRTQMIKMQPLLENNFMKRHFSFHGQGQSSFSCTIEAKIPGCTANPQIQMLLQERDQVVINPSAGQGNNVICDSARSMQPKQQLWQIISSYLQWFTPSEQADLMSKGTMSTSIRNILDKHRCGLTGDIYVDECLWSHLIENKVLGIQDKDNIKKEYATHNQAIGIIEWVHRRPNTYEDFRKSLQGANQGHVMKKYLPPMTRTPHCET